jgi:glycosyltransferase involved in cell wall biosynthesis
MEVQISVVIATHNRCKYLAKALQALLNQSLQKPLYEVLIVDNASTDETPKVVADFKKQVDCIRYIYEATPSANLARNIGWQHARGEIVAYMDDDAIPAFEWLENILKVFYKIHPMPGVVGGKVVPLWESERPTWLHDKLFGALSLIDYSKQACILDKKYPFSVNMAFQKKLLAEFNGFDLQLGRKGNKLLSGDETAIAIRIKKAGYSIYYDPAIMVEHYIPNARLTHKWFMKRYYWGGFSEALMWRILEKPTLFSWIKKLSFTIYAFMRNPQHVKYLFYIPESPDMFWFKCIVHARIGYISGLFSRMSN